MDKLTDEIRGKDADLLVVCIHKNLKDKRYLVIIDDIWDTRAWDLLKFSFLNDSNGSRIVFTTRLHDVAAYVGSSETYEVPLLSTEQSWTLLCAKVKMTRDEWKKVAENVSSLVSSSGNQCSEILRGILETRPTQQLGRGGREVFRRAR
ncbi:putative late blight resistance protein homolog R1A-3 [Henckelia pumila]|uniref:putative late blight resistance protein homolog R1A-3 n=1 Tax=Henckelia pumila TaxID=405737 RepID=UPI003C6E3582